MKQKLLNSSMLYKEAQTRLADLNSAIQSLEEKSTKYSNEQIHIVKTKAKVQFYIRQGPKDVGGTYISKKQKHKIQLLMQKYYEKKVLKPLIFEKQNILNFLKKTNKYPQIIQDIYSDNPQELKDYICPIDMSDEDYINLWISTPYKKKEITNNPPHYITEKGDYVRSKSELNIANALYKYKIPYKYECPILLNKGKTLHPDFTILNAALRKEIYWEHRGMMDDREYANHAVIRIHDYADAGIYVGDQLIITEETLSSPLGTKMIEDIIHHFFLA